MTAHKALASLIIVMLCALGMLTASPAAADQCAPPGVDSASSLPTNLGAAAKGPDVDKYTTAATEPLNTINISNLNLITPGTLTVGTLSDAPPSICINSSGQFTGFDAAEAERLQTFLDQVR